MILDNIRTYLFGDVMFLDLLLVVMAVDIMTGVLKAIKQRRLISKSAWFGYARKVGTFGIIIVANVIDIILKLNGMVAYVTVLFYIVTEILSILENSAEIGLKVPQILVSKIHSIRGESEVNENDKQ